jgi:hypothetical protein
VNIQGEVGDFPAVFDYKGPHGQVGDEMAIHHIDVDPVYTGLFGFADLVSKSGKIC